MKNILSMLFILIFIPACTSDEPTVYDSEGESESWRGTLLIKEAEPSDEANEEQVGWEFEYLGDNPDTVHSIELTYPTDSSIAQITIPYEQLSDINTINDTLPDQRFLSRIYINEEVDFEISWVSENKEKIETIVFSF
ncbi:hypothetical protein [Virgibacillus kimchii]